MASRRELSEFLHARAFKGLLLDSEVARQEEAGVLPRAKEPTATSALLGRYEEFFSREVQDRAEKMAYVYGIFYCFENLVRELVAQRLEERKGADWWSASVPENVRRRVEAEASRHREE